MNEPADEQWTRLLSFYDRIVPAVRAVDRDHILFLEGNTFSMDFSGFTDVFPNSVYAIHDYCGFGFPNRIGRYQGLKEQDEYIRKMYDRKAAFMKEHGVPVWNGKIAFLIMRLLLIKQASLAPSTSGRSTIPTTKSRTTSGSTC